MSDPRTVPNGPYDPQPQPSQPTGPSPVSPGHTPLEVPAAPSIEPIGIPGTDPGRSPDPAPSVDPGPAIPSGPVA